MSLKRIAQRVAGSFLRSKTRGRRAAPMRRRRRPGRIGMATRLIRKVTRRI